MASRHHLTHPGGVLPVVSSKWVSFVGQILLQRIRDLAGFDLSVVVFVPLISTHPKIKKDTADGSSGQITLFFKTHRQKKNGNANKSETILKQRINVKNPPPPHSKRLPSLDQFAEDVELLAVAAAALFRTNTFGPSLEQHHPPS